MYYQTPLRRLILPSLKKCRQQKKFRKFHIFHFPTKSVSECKNNARKCFFGPKDYIQTHFTFIFALILKMKKIFDLANFFISSAIIVLRAANDVSTPHLIAKTSLFWSWDPSLTPKKIGKKSKIFDLYFPQFASKSKTAKRKWIFGQSMYWKNAVSLVVRPPVRAVRKPVWL